MGKPTRSGEKEAGRYIGFKKLVKKLAAKKSLDFSKQIEFLLEKALVSKSSKVFDPKAVAASIGRKKYGPKKFAMMSAAGKRKKMHKSIGTFKAPIMKSA